MESDTSQLNNPLLLSTDNDRSENGSLSTSIYGRSENEETFWVTIQSFIAFMLGEHEPIENSASDEILISSIYLKDYENSRPCSLSTNLGTITEKQLFLHKIRYSTIWQFTLNIAVLLLFTASYFDRCDFSIHSCCLQLLITILAIVIFFADMLMRACLEYTDHADNDRTLILMRRTRSYPWRLPTIIILFCIVFENISKFIISGKQTVWMSTFKPVVFFYASTKARDALLALYHVSKIVSKVILIEIFLLLTFAAMACHLYFDFDAFRDLPTSFLSLFEMQTTAATPGVWIAVYNQYPSSAIFFVSFLVICVFYAHSIVLSVVFQTYIQAMTVIRQRSLKGRHESLKLAFNALHPQNDPEHSELIIEMTKVKRVIQLLRPHYDSNKIEVLTQILDPSSDGKITFHSFHERFPRVLRTSLRTSRSMTSRPFFLSSLSVFVAVLNLVYVLLLSSALEFLLLSNLIFPMGSFIVFLALLEVILRLQPSTSSINRHRILDGLSLIAALMSLTGLVMHQIQNSTGLQWLLFGRAIDMIRVMRLSRIFRFIVKRSGEVLPAIIGPLTLVLSSLHFFTYIGMLIWGGAINVGQHDGLVTPLYDLNNFNSYFSGLLTMFNIFVVNDWQTIAEVYLVADRCSNPYIVYTFFIGANLIGVCILLNVLTAFFVGAFVTKVEKKQDGVERSSLRLEIPSGVFNGYQHVEGQDYFHFIERQGFDSVMNTITGDDDSFSMAKKTFDLFELFSNMTADDKQVGFLVSCLQPQHFLTSQKFRSIIRGKIDENDLPCIIEQMFDDLLRSESPKVKKEHVHNEGKLILTGSICARNPDIILIVLDTTLD